MSAYDPNPDKPVVYIAGPYSSRFDGNIAYNVSRAVEVANALFEAGYYPFCPHAMGWMVSTDRAHRHKPPIAWETWMDWGCCFLLMSQAVYVIAPSPGTDIEVRIAREFGIPVVETLDELREALS